jgi:LuxR family maltose regulon positive regulatory protein
VEECLQRAEEALGIVARPSQEQQVILEQGIPETEQKRIAAGRIATIRAYSAITEDDIPRASAMAQRALALLPKTDYMWSLSSLALGGSFWGLGDSVAAEQAYIEASTQARLAGFRALAVSAACYAGIQQAKQARLYEAWRTLEEALELASGHGRQRLLVAGYAMVRLGDLSREWNDLEMAGQRITEGVEVCAQWGHPDLLADAYVIQARLRLALQDLQGARATLQQADELAQTVKIDPFLFCWLDDCRLQLWLAEGNLAAAVRWAKTSGLAIDGAFNFHSDLEHLNLARVLVARGTSEPAKPYLKDALGLLGRLLLATRKAGWVQEEIRTLVLQALALEASGDGPAALDALSRALVLAEPGGYVRIFVDAGAPMAALLRRAVARGLSKTYAGQLLTALGPETAGSHPEKELSSQVMASIPPLIDPLSERELEVLQFLATNLTSTEIAEELFVSVHTVRSHIKSIYSKLDVHRRSEAVQRAQDLGLL